MPNKLVTDSIYIQMAHLNATQSKAERKKVGAVLVTESGILLPGYNGTPRGMNNSCEYVTPEGLVTKQSVIHAELNCILKAAREGVSVVNSTLYVTLAPCEACAAMIVQAGIKEVYYSEEYRSTSGIDLLKEAGISITKVI